MTRYGVRPYVCPRGHGAEAVAANATTGYPFCRTCRNDRLRERYHTDAAFRDKTLARSRDPLAVHLDPVERFWAKVDKSGDCWLWTGSLSPKGYGTCDINYGSGKAHRVAYQLTYGPIPAGLTVDHDCHNRDKLCPGGCGCLHRRCVNPTHLSAVTAAENSLRRQRLCPRRHDPSEYTYRGRRRAWCKACERERQAHNKAEMAGDFRDLPAGSGMSTQYRVTWRWRTDPNVPPTRYDDGFRVEHWRLDYARLEVREVGPWTAA